MQWRALGCSTTGRAPWTLRSRRTRSPGHGNWGRHPAACSARSPRRTAWAGWPGRCRRANTACATCWKALSRCPPWNAHWACRAAVAAPPPAAAPRWRPRPARPPDRSGGAHRATTIPDNAAALRRTACRRPATICPIRTPRKTRPARLSGYPHRRSSDCVHARRERGCRRRRGVWRVSFVGSCSHSKGHLARRSRRGIDHPRRRSAA